VNVTINKKVLNQKCSLQEFLSLVSLLCALTIQKKGHNGELSMFEEFT